MPSAKACIFAALEIQPGIFDGLVHDTIPDANAPRYPNPACRHKPGYAIGSREDACAMPSASMMDKFSVP
jgi:hypothetical protein